MKWVWQGVPGQSAEVCLKGVHCACKERCEMGWGGALPFQQPELETEEGSETETNSHTPGFHRVTPRTDNGHW